MIRTKILSAVVASLCFAATLTAQGTAPQGAPANAGPTPAQIEAIVKAMMSTKTPQAAASTRASTEVVLPGRMVGNAWFPPAGLVGGPSTIRIDYSQPALRGRTAFGPTGVVKFGETWRLGANAASQLTTDVDLTIGGAFIPAGTYSLYAIPAQDSWKLAVNKQTRQWGGVYDTAQDLARIDMKVRTTAEPVETFTIWLVPDANLPTSSSDAKGKLKLVWGNTEASVDWKVGR